MSKISNFKTKLVKMELQQQRAGVSAWGVVDVFDFDSNRDENIHIDLRHEPSGRATFIPVEHIQGFTENTSAVVRTFDYKTNLESWTAVND